MRLRIHRIGPTQPVLGRSRSGVSVAANISPSWKEVVLTRSPAKA